MTLTIPKSWRDVLAKVQQVCPEAVLAGGALRDLDHGRSVKDLDIFVYAPDIETFIEIIFTLSAQNPSCEGSIVLDAKEYMDWSSEVVGLSSFTVEDTSNTTKESFPNPFEKLLRMEYLPTVQLIAINQPTSSAITRVDFGLCQIAFDGREVLTTPAYDHDSSNKVFTITRGSSALDLKRSLDRYSRLSQKYPEFHLDMDKFTGGTIDTHC